MSYQLDFTSLLPYWRELLWGAWLTLALSLVSIALGFISGALCAVSRADGTAIVKRVVGLYVELIRNTPLLVQIFLVYFGLASLGWRVSANAAAIMALVVNVAAYTCEIVRAGIESVHKSQLEAGECLGLSRVQIYWHIVLRPAVERVYPALTGQYVMLMLASSITSQISAEELTAVANSIQSDTFRSFETYIVVGLAYLALSFLVRGLLWGLGQLVFTRRRILGTPL